MRVPGTLHVNVVVIVVATFFICLGRWPDVRMEWTLGMGDRPACAHNVPSRYSLFEQSKSLVVVVGHERAPNTYLSL